MRRRAVCRDACNQCHLVVAVRRRRRRRLCVVVVAGEIVGQETTFKSSYIAGLDPLTGFKSQVLKAQFIPSSLDIVGKRWRPEEIGRGEVSRRTIEET